MTCFITTAEFVALVISKSPVGKCVASHFCVKSPRTRTCDRHIFGLPVGKCEHHVLVPKVPSGSVIITLFLLPLLLLPQVQGTGGVPAGPGQAGRAGDPTGGGRRGASGSCRAGGGGGGGAPDLVIHSELCNVRK